MYRFKISAMEDLHFRITGEELHHLVNVLRLAPGGKVIGFDNSGGQWLGVIETLDRESANCRIIEKNNPEVEARTKVFLVMGLSKGEKIE